MLWNMTRLGNLMINTRINLVFGKITVSLIFPIVFGSTVRKKILS